MKKQTKYMATALIAGLLCAGMQVMAFAAEDIPPRDWPNEDDYINQSPNLPEETTETPTEEGTDGGQGEGTDTGSGRVRTIADYQEANDALASPSEDSVRAPSLGENDGSITLQEPEVPLASNPLNGKNGAGVSGYGTVLNPSVASMEVFSDPEDEMEVLAISGEEEIEEEVDGVTVSLDKDAYPATLPYFVKNANPNVSAESSMEESSVAENSASQTETATNDETTPESGTESESLTGGTTTPQNTSGNVNPTDHPNTGRAGIALPLTAVLAMAAGWVFTRRK